MEKMLLKNKYCFVTRRFKKMCKPEIEMLWSVFKIEKIEISVKEEQYLI
jgi:hypothetical protein